jgi:hypothetical protein
MTTYTFIVEPFGFEVKMTAETEKQAHKMAWESLEESVKDNCACLDCVDQAPAE